MILSSKHGHVLGKGWRSGLLRGFGVVIFVFIVNIGAAVVAMSKSHSSENGQKTLYQGSCERVSQLDTYLHLAINILNMLLLGAGSYTMQCLSAPTREDIDKAHSEKYWFDIGILSLRNISRISPRPAWLWSLLLLTSLPLHLLYNSAVSSSIYSADYGIFMVTKLATNRCNSSRRRIETQVNRSCSLGRPPNWPTNENSAQQISLAREMSERALKQLELNEKTNKALTKQLQLQTDTNQAI